MFEVVTAFQIMFLFFPPLVVMNSVASLISQGHQERQQEQSFPHRDQKSFQTASSDLSFVVKQGLHPPLLWWAMISQVRLASLSLRNSYLLLSAQVHVLCMQYPLQE